MEITLTSMILVTVMILVQDDWRITDDDKDDDAHNVGFRCFPGSPGACYARYLGRWSCVTLVALEPCHILCLSPGSLVTCYARYLGDFSPVALITREACHMLRFSPAGAYHNTLVACHPVGLSNVTLVTRRVCHMLCLSTERRLTCYASHPRGYSHVTLATLAARS